jgi:hypothetical protein
MASNTLVSMIEVPCKVSLLNTEIRFVHKSDFFYFDRTPASTPLQRGGLHYDHFLYLVKKQDKERKKDSTAAL